MMSKSTDTARLAICRRWSNPPSTLASSLVLMLRMVRLGQPAWQEVRRLKVNNLRSWSSRHASYELARSGEELTEAVAPTQRLIGDTLS